MKALQGRQLKELIDLFRDARVLVIGDFILDQFVWGSVRRISPEAPVPVVKVERDSFMPGGSLNVANNIRTLGGTVYPCGVVGRDLEGRMLVKAMRREGIETGGVIYDSDRRTSLKTRIIAHSQQVVRYDRENTDDISKQACREILEFVKRKIDVVDVIVIEDYGKGVVQPLLLKEVTALAKRFCKPVLVDPKEKHFSYYTGVTAITPNRLEAYGVFENGNAKRRESSIEQVGRSLVRKLKCQALLITLGEDGMALFEKNGQITKIPTAAREIFDVSGAGDTVMAAFSLCLAAGASMQEAARVANVAAGIVVGKLGTATVSPSELRAALKNESGTSSSSRKKIRKIPVVA
ncbi:MAG: D-glycero-beta-D-manno-heptose-7-phosphate kinase [Candidatus Omnitrophota bacterium]|nr:D-glycero-beta-D-manno-heptose-7-phosphate kinase [Candidatus Omnitrophota bacterium]